MKKTKIFILLIVSVILSSCNIIQISTEIPPVFCGDYGYFSDGSEDYSKNIKLYPNYDYEWQKTPNGDYEKGIYSVVKYTKFDLSSEPYCIEGEIQIGHEKYLFKWLSQHNDIYSRTLLLADSGEDGEKMGEKAFTYDYIGKAE